MAVSGARAGGGAASQARLRRDSSTSRSKLHGNGPVTLTREGRLTRWGIDGTRVSLSTRIMPEIWKGDMKFQVGRFTCELSRDDNGKVRAAWEPEPPEYLTAVEHRQYRAGRAAFDLAEGFRKLGEGSSGAGRTTAGAGRPRSFTAVRRP